MGAGVHADISRQWLHWTATRGSPAVVTANIQLVKAPGIADVITGLNADRHTGQRTDVIRHDVERVGGVAAKAVGGLAGLGQFDLQGQGQGQQQSQQQYSRLSSSSL